MDDNKILRVGVCLVLATAVGLAGCQTGGRSVQVGGSATHDPRHPDPRAMEDAAASQSALIGQPAPDFVLPTPDDTTIRLSDLRGRWVVLYFYPQNDTPGCTCQATEFTDLLKTFHQAGAEVLGVSPDDSASHRFFRLKYDLKLTLLSDPEHRVMKRYGAWVVQQLGDQHIGRVIRSTVLIDPDGVVAYHWPEVVPQGHAQRVRDKLASLQAAAESAPH